jgi:hypothetical protein
VTIGIEFVWPIFLLLTVAFIKKAQPPGERGPCFYKPLELPNGDFLSFTKSFVCMLDYKCYDSSRLKAIKPYPDQYLNLQHSITNKYKSQIKKICFFKSESTQSHHIQRQQHVRRHIGLAGEAQGRAQRHLRHTKRSNIFENSK